MLGEERREYILNLILKTGSVKAADIAKYLVYQKPLSEEI